MAHLTDERGNPIQLTDEYGNPVTLTDEHGNPMHLSGVAYSTSDAPPPAATATNTTVGDVLGASPVEAYDGQQLQPQPRRMEMEEVEPTHHTHSRRSTSSSSSTSSDDELREGEVVEGGARTKKKKGITQKIKEKLNLGGPKDKDRDRERDAATSPHKIVSTDATTQKVTVEHVEEEKAGAFVASDTTTTTVTTEHRDQAKKGVMEKIMDKLPGHHSTH